MILPAAVGMLLFSCSGTVRDPDKAVEKLLNAYGGPQKAKTLATFSGKGFSQKLTTFQFATNYPLDIYQKGLRYKSAAVNLHEGKITSIVLLINDGESFYRWSSTKGRENAPEWEFYFTKYKFPYVLTWLQEAQIQGKILEVEGKDICRVQFEQGDDIVTLTIDSKSWLLQAASVDSKSDPLFTFKEVYSEYREVEGTPFPNRFAGYLRGDKYYEFLIPVINLDVELPDDIFTVTAEDTSWMSQAPPPSE
ncbi:MAG: hypothetical protein JXB45_06225 [Candidatus Krumholzibacteriota bacterium]|nr:hypothetical protein [Candidatus Krumholzibacteriota bacterium]